MINKKYKYLIACSGGPDSMALLDIYRSKGYSIEVGHVNYHKRDTSNRDEEIVKNYCEKYNIVFNKFDYEASNVKGNFQADARIARYEFFNDVCIKHNLNGVLVAHQEDDLIETYLMQKAKKLGVKFYGLTYSNELYGVNVYRPLLDKTKKQLEDYCKKHNIEYGIDESNLTDHYERNKVRHSKVEKMSRQQRDEILLDILRDNNELLTIENKTLKFMYKGPRFGTNDFINFKYLPKLIREIFDTKMSNKTVDEIIRQLKTCDHFVLLKNNIYLVKEYDYIEYFKKPDKYSYKLKDIELGDYGYFRIQRTSKDRFSGVTVSEKDFPLTIRNYEEGDSIAMSYGTKKVNRFFIDNKISYRERLTWPVVLNKEGSAILVPGIGCDINHYSNKHSMFVLK